MQQMQGNSTMNSWRNKEMLNKVNNQMIHILKNDAWMIKLKKLTDK